MAATSRNGAGADAPTAATFVSAVIPATDRPATLERCVAALRGADDPPDEIIVVHGPPRLGPAGARNAGAAVARGSILLFVDSDVVVHRDAVRGVRAAMAEDPGLTALFGSYDDRPSEHGAVSTFRNMLHHYVHQSAPGPATTFWAGLGAVRRDAFVRAGGYDDERFAVPSVEDIELGLRLSAAGGRIRLEPRILGTHLKHWRLGSMVVTDIAHRGVPWMSIVLAHRASAARLNLRGRHLLGALSFTAGLGAVVAGRPRALSLFGATYLATNARFYGLLLRRAGARDALIGAGLLAIHNAASLVSAPIGAAAFARRRRWAPGRGTAAHADGRWDAARWMHASNGAGPVAGGARHTVEVLPRSGAA